MAVFVFREAEAVSADDGAIFQSDEVAENAMLANDCMRVSEKVIANLRARINDNVRQKRRVWTQANVGTDDGISADVRIGTNFGGWINYGGRMNSWRISGRLVKETERSGEGVVGIFDTQRSYRDFLEIGFDKNCCGVGGAGETSVLWIRNEGDFCGAGFFDSLYAGDFKVSVAAEFSAETTC